jgi:hypothetical protein
MRPRRTLAELLFFRERGVSRRKASGPSPRWDLNGDRRPGTSDGLLTPDMKWVILIGKKDGSLHKFVCHTGVMAIANRCWSPSEDSVNHPLLGSVLKERCGERLSELVRRASATANPGPLEQITQLPIERECAHALPPGGDDHVIVLDRQFSKNVVKDRMKRDESQLSAFAEHPDLLALEHHVLPLEAMISCRRSPA